MLARKITFTGSFIFLLIFSLSLKGQLNAEFGATPTSGCAPLLVQFSDSSTGNPTYWKWDLGNNTTSFLQNPSVSYFDPGVYTVTLLVKNGSGQDSIKKVQYIRVFAAPVVQFTSNKITGCYPLTVHFSDQSLPGSGTISSWQWDFGDGISSFQQNPVHTYTSSGNFNVTLQITNSNGCVKTITKPQYIKINTGVTAGFNFTAPTSCSVPVTISFHNTSTGTGTLTYKWLFGDGGTSILQDPQHTYTNPGTFSVSLIVINSNGCRDTLVIPNAITAGTVNTNFVSASSVCIGNAITFTSTSTPPPASVLWNFGDGTFSNQNAPVKIYSLPGVYQVKLVANFGACIDSVTKPVTVNPKPAAAFTADDSTNCKTPFTVSFINQTVNGTSYQWNFGDGSTDATTAPVHTYTNYGSFTVQLIATNSFGCKDTITKPNYILIKKPVVTLINVPDSGCIPLTKTFFAAVNSVDPVTDYLWDLGDGTTSTNATPTNIYSIAGVYPVSVIITTANGCKDTAAMPKAITVDVKPHASFSADPRIQCAKSAIQFSDSSTGGATGWYWDFGDGVSTTEQNPQHQYIDTGYFPVMLIAYKGGCPDTLLIDSFIYINPPIGKFDVQLNCARPFERIFTDRSIGADEWHWSFGDGDTSILQNPVHSYASSGVYTVTLYVRNTLTGCDFTVSKPIQVVIVQNNFIANDTVICKRTSVNFVSNVNLTEVKYFDWNFGDGAYYGDSVNHVEHVYSVAGSYTVRLIITDILGCKDTLIKPFYIRVNGPTAKFAPAVIGSCSNSTVNFRDSSLTDGLHPIQTWEWNYGDGITEILTAPPFQHTYAATGLYVISLKVTDSEGCTDSFTLPTSFIISQPVAAFRATDTLTCPGHQIRFINQSAGGTLQYKWYFGDGTTSTVGSPFHTYTADGLYTVSLRVTNQYGCIDSLAKINYIRVVTPVSDFSMSDSVSTCPPLIVQFTNLSNPVFSSLWDFGDGTFATTRNPSHFYSTPGIYNVTLTITGPVSCTDIKRKTIRINGPKGVFSYTPLYGCSPLTVFFTSNTVNTSSFIWDFNDGSTLSTTNGNVSHTYSYPGRYVPKMILLDNNGCVVPIVGIDTIVVKGVIPKFAFNHNTLCDSGMVYFRDSSTSNDSIISYTWYFGDGTISHDKNPNHYYSSTGLYYPKLVILTASGCSDSSLSLLPVKIVFTPHVDINRSPDGCTPLTMNFSGIVTVPDTSQLIWTWNMGNGNTYFTQNPPAQLYSNPGNYLIRLIATNSSGCKDTADKNVLAFTVPDVKAGADTLICMGRGVTLNATGADSIYTWSPGRGLSCTICPNPIATPDSVTNYFVTGTTKRGCTDKDTVLVKVKYPLKINFSNTDTICVGEIVPLFASGAYSYAWSPATWLNNPNIANPTATPSASITYQVIGTDDRKCFSDTGHIAIKVYPIPVVNAGPDKTVNAGYPIDIIPAISSDINSVIWSPTTFVVNSIYPGISVKPLEDIEYTVDVKNEGGCVSSDKIKIFVLCDGNNIFFPNTFSPNNDGSNDIFYPRGSGVFKIKSLRIFSRWGEVMFEQSNFNANDPAFGWNGKFKNAPLNNDVYVYTAEILCNNATIIILKGNVAITK